MASRGVRLLACAWALAAAAQTSPKALAESTDARNALTLALPNASTAAGNASIFRGARGPRGGRVVSVARPVDPLTSPTPDDIVSSEFVYEDYAEGAFISIDWANSPPGSRTNASTPREVSWTDPEAVERRHITLQPSLPKEPSPDRTLRV